MNSSPHAQIVTEVAEKQATKQVTDRPPGIPVIPPLSQSRRELMACGALYEAREIRRERMPDSLPAIRGHEIHFIISEYIKHCLATRQQTDFQFFDRLSDRGVSTEALDIVRPIGEDLVVDHDQVLGVEMKLLLGADLEPVHRHNDECFLPNKSGDGLRELVCEDPELEAHFESTIDLVQCPSAEEAVIDDWKSHWQLFSADTFQGQLYPLQIFQHYPGIQRIAFRLRFVRYGLGAMRQVEYIRERDLPWLKERVLGERRRQLAMHKDAEEGNSLGAIPGDHCAWCPMVMRCPVKAINPYTNQSPEDLLRFARWASAALAQAKGVLKAHVNAYGPVKYADGNGNEVAAEFSLINKRRYPLQDCQPIIIDWDIEHRENLAGGLFISGLSSKLKAKKRAGLLGQLEPYSVTRPETRFKISGVEEDDEEED